MIAGLTGMAGGLGLGGFGTQASLAIPIDAYRYFPTGKPKHKKFRGERHSLGFWSPLSLFYFFYL